MFGIGSTELLVILVVALIVLGPRNLASFSRSLGKMMGEFRRVSTDFQRTLNYEAAQEEIRQKNPPSPSRSQTDGTSASGMDSIPPDSPIAKAVEKAWMEAQGQERAPEEQDRAKS